MMRVTGNQTLGSGFSIHLGTVGERVQGTVPLDIGLHIRDETIKIIPSGGPLLVFKFFHLAVLEMLNKFLELL
jgi:hypothetical protein